MDLAGRAKEVEVTWIPGPFVVRTGREMQTVADPALGQYYDPEGPSPAG
jgi:hypothetical protein